MLKRKKEKFNLRKQKGWLAGSSATQTICVSFLLVIAAGTLLLSLPIASKQGRLGLVDALFTATSATCVTGLVVRDTWTQFTFFGQAVLLLLIQVGGLGLVTHQFLCAGGPAADGLPGSAAAGRKRLGRRPFQGHGGA